MGGYFFNLPPTPTRTYWPGTEPRVAALDVSDPATFDRWCATPAYDTRTLEEFAADGGFPVGPPNRDVREGRQPDRLPYFSEDRRLTRDELPPLYPDDEDDIPPLPRGGTAEVWPRNPSRPLER